MFYRIRYQDDVGHGQAETIVEAHNPTEALVKFSHTGRGYAEVHRLREKIVSISAEEPEETGPW